MSGNRAATLTRTPALASADSSPLPGGGSGGLELCTNQLERPPIPLAPNQLERRLLPPTRQLGLLLRSLLSVL